MSQGNCGDTLANGMTCTPECQNGHMATDYHCDGGTLTNAECTEIPVTETGPFTVQGYYYSLLNTSSAANSAGDGTSHSN